MCIKGLVYRLSHDCHFDINCHVSTAQCRSSLDGSVYLLSLTICTTVVVSDWCITTLAHGWLGFDPKHCWYFQRRKLIPQRSVVVAVWLSCCLIVGIHASGISIPLSLLMLLG